MKLLMKVSLMLAVLLSLWMASSPASAQNLSLLSPPDSSVCVPPTIHLSWGGLAGYPTFKFILAKDSDLSDIVVSADDVTDLFYDVYDLDFATTYYWKVIAIKSGDTITNHSDIWNFTTRQGPITLTEPDSNSFCVSVNHKLVWEAAAGALSYRLEVSSTPFFNAQTTTVYDNIAASNFTLSGLDNNTRYWWRVRGNFEGCNGYWSEAWTFRTKPMPVVLFSPEDNTKGIPIFAAGFPYNFEVKWHPTTDAISYDVQLADDATPANILLEQLGVLDTTLAINNVLPDEFNKSYRWRVRALIDNDSVSCSLDWSDWFTIKTPYGKPLLSEPLNNATCVSLEVPFTWQPPDDVLAYDIHLSSKADFSDTLHFAENWTDTLVVFPLDNEFSTYYWRVRASDANNVGVWSDGRQFRTTYKTPAVVYPLDKATGVPLTVNYVWKDKGEDALYHIQISDTDDFSNILADVDGLNERTFEYQHTLHNKYYYWRIKVKIGDCESAWSQDYVFKTYLAAPQLLQPANLATEVSNTPTFKWAAVPTTQYYELQLDTIANFTSAIIRQNIPASEIKLANPLLENQKYYWKVKATNQEGSGAWSQVFSFTTTYIPPTAPIIISPDNEEKKLPIDNVELVWSKVDRADSYHLQVTKLISFSNLILDTLNLIDTTYTLSGLDNYVTYQFRVRAINQGGHSEWSEPFAFRTINVVPTTPPDLTTPAHTAANEQTNVRLSWLATNHAEGYHLQVSKNEDFTNLLLEEKSLYVPYHNVYGLEYDTRYYWRVRAWNEAGIGPWSEERYFKTISLVSVQEELMSKYGVTLYPNPVSNIAELNINLPTLSTATLRLYNSNGVELPLNNGKVSGIGSNSIKIDVSAMPAGVYIWKLSIDNDVLTGKLNVVK